MALHIKISEMEWRYALPSSFTLRCLRSLMSANFDETELDVYGRPYKEIPEEDKWRPQFMKELMNARRAGPFDSSTREDLQEICDFVCQS